MTPVAALVDVYKRFGTTAALDGIDLRVEPGEVVALLGRNGAGKTTAIRVLLGLRRPDSGHALLFGLDPRRPEARRRCGVTPQETDLPETLRVQELLEFVRAHFVHPTPSAELLRRFALDGLAHRQAGGLSGGERRRLAVALAFAGDPELVFLDEPSSGLDREARGNLWESIRGYAQRGRTVLLTTHDLAEAEALATRIVVLERGRLVLQGAVWEIAARAGLQQVRIRSQLLPTLPGVEHVAANGKHSILFTRDADAVVRALVAADADLAELEVLPISLEQALDVEAAR